MEFTTKIIITIFIVAIISILCITTQIFYIPASINSSESLHIMYTANEDWQPTPYTANADWQTSYVLETTPTIITPMPTPTPLYYEKLKNPDEPCQETAMIYEKCWKGLITDEGYCKYWTYEYRKACPGARW